MEEVWRRRAVRNQAFELALALICSGWPLSCSLLVNYSPTQCETNADCARFPGKTCSEGVCVAQAGAGTGGGGGGCVSNAQCSDEHSGIPYRCPSPGAACAPLLSEDC